MGIAIHSVDYRVFNMKTRLPFQYGIATMTALPHIFVTVEISLNGKKCRGISSEGLPPKWFTKNSATSFESDLKELFAVICQAGKLFLEVGEGKNMFDIWLKVYSCQKEWGQAHDYPCLLTGFGVSLIERAVIDALCRWTGVTFFKALQTNLLGINLGSLHEELRGKKPADFLSSSPPDSILIRHTVGLSDPLSEAEINESQRVNDGLPQSLAHSIQCYSLSRFKIKLCGDFDKDVKRLLAISGIIKDNVKSGFGFTLDGNEQFNSAAEFRIYWKELSRVTQLTGFLKHLLFVEQPIKRNAALLAEVKEIFSAWKERPLLIIDESDAEIKSAAKALSCGYQGTSHKNCKGIIKGISNACLIENRRRQSRSVSFFMSGEDLANIGPVALHQDLAVMSVLGMKHVERNGHHYFKGLSMYPAALQEQIMMDHSDLYHLHDRGFPCLSITSGSINIKTLVNSPFGLKFIPDISGFTPLEQWEFSSLGLEK